MWRQNTDIGWNMMMLHGYTLMLQCYKLMLQCYMLILRCYIVIHWCFVAIHWYYNVTHWCCGVTRIKVTVLHAFVLWCYTHCHYNVIHIDVTALHILMLQCYKPMLHCRMLMLEFTRTCYAVITTVHLSTYEPQQNWDKTVKLVRRMCRRCSVAFCKTIFRKTWFILFRQVGGLHDKLKGIFRMNWRSQTQARNIVWSMNSV